MHFVGVFIDSNERHRHGCSFVLVLDGVYVRNGDAPPKFQELLAPEDNEVVALTTLVAGRIQALLKRRGIDINTSEDNLFDEEPA